VKNPQRTVDRFKFFFVAVFVAFIGMTAGYWAFYQRPAQACENAGNWWDPQARVCGTVVYLPDLTGRYQMGEREFRAPETLPARPVRQAAERPSA